MATALFTSVPCSSSSRAVEKRSLHLPSFSSQPSFCRNPFGKGARFSRQRLNFYVKSENSDKPSSSAAVEEPKDKVIERKDLRVENESTSSGHKGGEKEEEEEEEREKRQEMDWKVDEEFKDFMGNPSIEAAIKLEKKRADRKLNQLDRERSDNPLVGLFNNLARDNLSRERERERLEKAQETFKALDLNKLKSCFGFDTFFATDVRRFGDGGIFVGNLRKPMEEVIPKLEKKLSKAAGRQVVVWFMDEKTNDITKQIAKGVTAARYGVELSPSFLVPSTWTGCLGVMNNYESLLPNKKALFDIPVARTASAYLTSLVPHRRCICSRRQLQWRR